MIYDIYSYDLKIKVIHFRFSAMNDLIRNKNNYDKMVIDKKLLLVHVT